MQYFMFILSMKKMFFELDNPLFWAKKNKQKQGRVLGSRYGLTKVLGPGFPVYPSYLREFWRHTI